MGEKDNVCSIPKEGSVYQQRSKNAVVRPSSYYVSQGWSHDSQ